MAMKILIRVAAGVGLATLVVILAGVLLPADYTVARAVTIAAPPDSVFAVVDDLARWEGWAPWLQADPSVRITLSDPARGQGATLQWAGDAGNGELTITGSQPGRSVALAMVFDGRRHLADNRLEIAPADGGSVLTWRLSGDSGWNLLQRYGGLFADTLVGPMFEEGLQRLKLLVETGRAG